MTFTPLTDPLWLPARFEREGQAPGELEGRVIRDMLYRQGFLARYIPLPVEGSDDPAR